MVKANEELRQKIIDEQHNGNETEFNTSIASAYNETIEWDQLVDSVNILPDLEQQAHVLIKKMLGFLPEQSLIIPHEPFLRALIVSRDTGLISDEEFYTQAEQCLLPIRNKWLETPHSSIEYSNDIHKQYAALIPEYKQKVRKRLSKFLGYEPLLQTSISVEISLNNTMFKDILVWPEFITPADIQAILIIKYREVLLSKSKADADLSSLPVDQISMFQNVDN